jgi:hypothetical protein
VILQSITTNSHGNVSLQLKALEVSCRRKLLLPGWSIEDRFDGDAGEVLTKLEGSLRKEGFAPRVLDVTILPPP